LPFVSEDGVIQDTMSTPPPPAPKPSRTSPAPWLLTLLAVIVAGLVRAACGGPSDAELAIEKARGRNEAAGRSRLSDVRAP